MLLYLALAVALLDAPQDSIRVEASLSAARIAAGETTVLLISVETDGVAPGEIPVPVLPTGLDLGPISDFSQVQMAFPGGRRRITRREIVVLAREPGQYRIPSVVVEVDGQRRATPALALLVLPTQAAGGAGAPRLGAVRLRAWADPDSVYVGQQVLYQAEALFPEELRLRQARAPVFEPPGSTGFWVYDLPDAVSVSLRIVEGAAFEVQNFKQVLFPLSAGRFTLPASRMLYEVRQGVLFTPDRREAVSEPVAIHVRALPAGAPDAFDGAVGRYRLSAEVLPERVAPGEPATLRLTIEGTGNVKALARPSLRPIPGVEVYPGAERVETGFGSGRISGRKVMEWTLVPRQSGGVAVPPIRYAWFDPDARGYQEVVTDTLTLTATSAAGGSGDTVLAPLRPQSDPVPLAWTRTPAFLSLQAVPLLLLGVAAALRRARRRSAARTGEGEAGLERAAALLDQPRACLDELARYAHMHDSPAARHLLERIRAARYRPEPPERHECEGLLGAARRLPRGTTVRAHLLPLALLAGLTLAVAPQPTRFTEGVRAYRAGDYDAAVRAFADHVRDSPRDAAGWYDLGNAWVRTDRTGPAAWAWLRALELRPRDDWARRNLVRSGAAHALADLAPTVRLSTEELSLAAAILWWVLVFLAVAARRRRGRAVPAAASSVLLLLLVAGGILAARSLRPPRAITLAPTPLLSAPVLRADILARIDQAEPVTLLEERGDWVRARTRDLREGWAERRDLGRL